MSDEPIKHGLNELVALCIEYEVRKPGMAAAIAKIIDDCTDNRDVQIALLTRDLAAAREQLAEANKKAAAWNMIASCLEKHTDRPLATKDVVTTETMLDWIMRATNAEKQLAAANATVEKCKASNAVAFTADGVPVCHGDTVYTRSLIAFCVQANMTIPVAVYRNQDWTDMDVAECYSTRTAAEAAREGNASPTNHTNADR